MMDKGAMIDIFQDCPVLQTEHFLLRLIQESDAVDLLECYSDPMAHRFFNADHCTNNFRYETVGDMAVCIRFWLDEYKKKSFVRFAVVDKQTGRAIGTVEMFSTPDFLPEGDGGVLRIDLASRFETAELLSELLRLANERFYALFGADMIVIKGRPAEKNRVSALIVAGYAPYDWKIPDREHYYIRRKTQ
jgi:[ribosomal protein S5]-alanine N-acetyltransferase